MAKITDINSGAEYEDGGELTRAEQRMLAQAKRAGKKETKSKAKRILSRFLVALCTLILVVGAVLAVVYRDELNIDGLKRMVSYLSLEKDEDGQAEEIFYDSDDTNCFAQLDNALLVCSESIIQLFSQSGNTYISEVVTLENPTISADGAYAVVYDLGGTELYGIAGKQLAYTQTADGTILNARMNANGYLTLITKQTGYKGVITVYDSKYRAKVQVSISSAYVMDALVSDDGKTLAVLTIGAEDNAFATLVSFYDVSTGELVDPSPYTISGGLAVDLQWQDEGVLLQMDNGIQYVTPDAGVTGSWVNDEGYLRGYAFSEPGYQVMIWSKYQTGYQGNLELVNQTGALLAEISVSQEVYSVSTAGNYIALLFTNQLIIYTYDEGLTQYASLVDTAGARQVIMRSDGSALLLGSESATLYVP